jgi:hypothetical protein
MLGETETERTERVVVEVGVVPAGRVRASASSRGWDARGRGGGDQGADEAERGELRPKGVGERLEDLRRPFFHRLFEKVKVMEKPTCTADTWEGDPVNG